MTTTLRVQPDYKTYKVAIKNNIKNNIKPTPKTYTLKDNQTVSTWEHMEKLIKNI